MAVGHHQSRNVPFRGEGGGGEGESGYFSKMLIIRFYFFFASLRLPLTLFNIRKAISRKHVLPYFALLLQTYFPSAGQLALLFPPSDNQKVLKVAVKTEFQKFHSAARLHQLAFLFKFFSPSRKIKIKSKTKTMDCSPINRLRRCRTALQWTTYHRVLPHLWILFSLGSWKDQGD